MDPTVWCVESPAAGQLDPALSRAVVGFPTLGSRGWAHSPAALRRARTEIADVVHQHGIWTLQGLVTRRFRRRGVPTIIAPHGSLEPLARHRSWWKKRMALMAYEWDNLRLASCLHATAESELRSLRQFGVRTPVAVIPYGISSTWLESQGDPARFRARLQVDPGVRILLFLSRLHPIKGLPILLEALAAQRHQLRGWRLVIAGPDERGHRGELEALAARLDIDGMLTFAGPAFGQEKRDAFASADLFVLPSHSENFGIVVAEALGAGVPVLTTQGAPWEALVEHRCGWWVPVRSDAIGQALLEASRLPRAELRAMGERGRALADSRFLWPAIASEMVAVYRWLLEGGSRPSTVVTD